MNCSLTTSATNNGGGMLPFSMVGTTVGGSKVVPPSPLHVIVGEDMKVATYDSGSFGEENMVQMRSYLTNEWLGEVQHMTLKKISIYILQFLSHRDMRVFNSNGRKNVVCVN